MIFFSSLSVSEKIYFTKHLAIFLKAGISLNEALDSLAEEEKDSQTGKIVRVIQLQVENGQPLHKALAKAPQTFDIFFTSMVEIGEVSGTLEKSLEFLSTKLIREDALRKKIRGMLYYPAVVLLVSLAIGAFISFFVLPKLGEMFRSFNVELPLATRILLHLANFLKDYGLLLTISVLGLLVLFRILISTLPKFKFFWHKTKFRLPVIGKALLSAALSAFFRNMGTMLSTGIPLEQSLETESKISENLAMQKIASDLRKAVSQGQRLGEELRKKKEKTFPPLAVKMVSVGEASGKLEESFLYLADFFEEETEVRAKNAVAFLEPALLVFIGVVVGFVAIAVILPIYSLTGSIHR
jgi:type II secretory pathway component PulF